MLMGVVMSFRNSDVSLHERQNLRVRRLAEAVGEWRWPWHRRARIDQAGPARRPGTGSSQTRSSEFTAHQRRNNARTIEITTLMMIIVVIGK